jgi:hypothetical protein
MNVFNGLTLFHTVLLLVSSMSADEILRIVCIAQLLIIWGLFHKSSKS